MQRITGGKFKPIVIAYLCLFVTITNCDNKQLLLRDTDSIASDDVQSVKRDDVQSLPSQVNPATLVPSNSVTKRLTDKENKTDGKINSSITPDGLKHENEDLTSKSSNAINSSKVKTGENVNSTSTSTRNPGISANIQPPINTGALLRGASVFLGLSLAVIGYIIFRCARLNKNRTQMVRKYGILAHRQDVEMRPLPLDDEDEDDTTVFDASEIAGIHDKHRRMT